MPQYSLQFLAVHSKVGEEVIFQDLTFHIAPQEQWAIIGTPEYTKSHLLQLIAGRSPVTKGRIIHRHAAEYLNCNDEEQQRYRSPQDLISYVSLNHHFRNRHNLKNFYYQQRFNSMDADDADTVEQYLRSIKPKRSKGFWNVEKVTILLDLQALMDKATIMLSNGETRRLMIAAALLKCPTILLFEKPLMGLDNETKARFDKIMSAITVSGTQVIMSTNALEIPSTMTHIAQVVGKEIVAQGIKGHVQIVKMSDGIDDTLSPDKKNVLSSLLVGSKVLENESIIRMNNVNIQYGNKTILKDIDWEVVSGEAWAIKGHNGAGKSTLLSLINGDNPQAYSNDIILFGRKRGSGESIWDIKKEIGYVSPEFHQYFPKYQNPLQIILSGLFDTVGLFRKPTEKQVTIATKWLELFDLAKGKQQPFWRLSPDQQRLCLLARALIKNPKLLILDEPVQSLDTVQRDFFKAVIDHIHHSSHTTILYVSHYTDDIPSCVTRTITLSEGTRI